MLGIPDVQSLQVFPGTTLPSAVEPVRMSCSLGFCDPGQAPGTGCPRSSTNKIGFPLRSWRSMRSLPTISPLALNQGPLPIRSRALVGLLLFAGSRSTLKYARHVLSPCPTAVAESLANPIRARQAAQVAGFTLGARNKKTHARGWGAGGVNNWSVYRRQQQPPASRLQVVTCKIS